MKKLFLNFVVIASMITLIGCSSDKTVTNNVVQQDNQIQIEENIEENIEETTTTVEQEITDCFESISEIEEEVVPEHNYSEVSFLAQVVEKNDTSVIVAPFKDQIEYNSSDKISFEIADVENSSIIEVGGYLRIYYDGVVRESYPAQITVSKVDLILEEEIKNEQQAIKEERNNPNNYYLSQSVTDQLTPVLMLNEEDGTFQLHYDSLNNYFAFGNYFISGNKITCNTDDGMYTIIFNVMDENTIVFDKQASSSFTSGDFTDLIDDKSKFTNN